MKFSAQEEFGLRCMIALAREGDDGYLTIPMIAVAEGLTQSHIAKLLSVLRKAGFINSHRGQAGGYTLSRPAKQIAVSDLLAELGGRLAGEGFCVRFTGQNEECVHTDDCSLIPLWFRIQESVDSALKGMSLQDLAHPDAGVNVKFFEEPRQRMSTSI